jgi:hypothetical protein
MCTDAFGSLWASGSFWSVRKLLGAFGGLWEREPLGASGSLWEILGGWDPQGASESFGEPLGISAGFWKPPGP